jgi:ribonuclease T1
VFFSARPPRWQALRAWGLVVTLAGSVLAASAVQAKEQAPETAAASGVVTLAQLPAEARATHRLILSGGPFPFDKDGIVFGNRERALPRQARGYYHEYTVKTPGARNRGARRIVCGGRQLTAPEACFYTGDHYASFQKIAP